MTEGPDASARGDHAFTFEAQETAEAPPNADVEEVCNDLDALALAPKELASPKGLQEGYRASARALSQTARSRLADRVVSAACANLPRVRKYSVATMTNPPSRPRPPPPRQHESRHAG